ncbi:MFS transporter [Glaciimonas soli]|uniref:MFS transporter n=1 Tax=Glaciimonas soli TaxID=2590999 RepID=A0A843YPE1_9BURK|nr:hypothetical protein [Glaciimonas soli]MQQ99846.1 hypothetical protein [Glaciimonas soli]
MLKSLFRSLRRHRWLRLLSAGFIASSIGTGLTFVIVFGELLRLNAPSSALAIAYALATVPGLAGSFLGEKLLVYRSPFFILILGELIGFCGLAIPIVGIAHNSVILLQFAELLAAFSIGMTLPAMELVFKRGLSEDELSTAASVETVIFASNTLFGIGLGSFLYGHFKAINILMLDGASYCVSIFLIVLAYFSFKGCVDYAVPEASKKVKWMTLTIEQRFALLTLPSLALVGVPAMALLPSLASGSSNGRSAAATLPLLFARSLGQLLGPFLLSPDRFGTYSKDGRVIFILLAAFLACYLSLPLVDYLWLSLFLVFVAHLFSNLVLALGWYAILSNFTEEFIASAIARSYRWNVVTASSVSLGAGVIADHYGASYALAILSGGGLLLAAFVMLRLRKLSPAVNEFSSS